MVASVHCQRDDQMMINDPVVEDDAVDYSDHGIIQVYKIFAHNDAQKADDILQEKSDDTLEQQGDGNEQKDDGKIHHNTVEAINQDKQEDPQMRMSSHNMFDDEQQQGIDQNQGRQERKEVVARLAPRATAIYPRQTRPKSLDRRKRLLDRDVDSKLDGTRER